MRALGQTVSSDALSEARARLARALAELEQADEELAAIARIVTVRENDHRITSEWMKAMSHQARMALAAGALDRLMTPDWVSRLSSVGDRHDVATTRLSDALSEFASAISAHAKIARRFREARAEVQRLERIVGPTGYRPPVVSPTGSVQPGTPFRIYVPPTGRDNPFTVSQPSFRYTPYSGLWT